MKDIHENVSPLDPILWRWKKKVKKTNKQTKKKKKKKKKSKRKEKMTKVEGISFYGLVN